MPWGGLSQPEKLLTQDATDSEAPGAAGSGQAVLSVRVGKGMEISICTSTLKKYPNL